MVDLVEAPAPDAQETPAQEPVVEAPAAEVAEEPTDLISRGAADEAAPVAAPADWPEGWRNKMAGDDPKAQKLAERYKSPQDVMNALRAAQSKLSSGEDRVKPEGEAEQAAWRKERDIPETSTGYDMNDLGNGIVIGEADKPIIDGVLEKMHGVDVTSGQAKAIVAGYFEQQEKALTEQTAIDKSDQTQTEDALHAEWGQEYRGNMNQLKGFLDSAPDGIGQLLLGGRLGDGTGIANHAGAVKWLLDQAQQINPMGTVVPAGGDTSTGVASKISSIEAVMRDDPDKYWKDEPMQAEYQNLLAYQERQKK